MKHTMLFSMIKIAIVCCIFLHFPVKNVKAAPVIIDHNNTDITVIPEAAIEKAKSNLHIAYGHSSHGAQLTLGMAGLVAFANQGGLGLSHPDDIFSFNNGGSGGALDLRDAPFTGIYDLGSPDRIAWATATRNYLLSNPDINVIIWAWCGQVSSATEADIDLYLSLMSGLEMDFPNVKFVYMTGHLDGTGENGNLNRRNQQIRDYCIRNDKILYDFADIESYDPDGNTNYMTLLANDGCNYDSNGDGFRDRNWATDWQNSHTEGEDWYNCNNTHSESLNANRKAYTAWQLWAALADWSPLITNHQPVLEYIGNKRAESSTLLEFTVNATDPDSGDVLTYSASGLPDGATFNATTGLFQWIPTSSDEGRHKVLFSVTDNGSPQAHDQKTATLSVMAPGRMSFSWALFFPTMEKND